MPAAQLRKQTDNVKKYLEATETILGLFSLQGSRRFRCSRLKSAEICRLPSPFSVLFAQRDNSGWGDLFTEYLNKRSRGKYAGSAVRFFARFCVPISRPQRGVLTFEDYWSERLLSGDRAEELASARGRLQKMRAPISSVRSYIFPSAGHARHFFSVVPARL